MFVQIIEGNTSDAEGLKRQGERWNADVRPGAAGFVGATEGVSPDGKAITIARFESEDAARANSGRPEQDAWWADTAKYYEGEPTFTESSDTKELLAGPSADARFVQIMKMAGVDRLQVEKMDDQFDEFAHVRPDILGTLRIWTGADACVEVAYFTTEAEARQGEQVEMPAEMQEAAAEFEELMKNTEFIDLPDPQHI